MNGSTISELSVKINYNGQTMEFPFGMLLMDQFLMLFGIPVKWFLTAEQAATHLMEKHRCSWVN